MTDKSGKYPPGPNEGSPYCSQHRRYYSADAECMICRYEESTPRRSSQGMPRIQRCPVCGEMSLLWYQCSNQCECLNLDCKLRHAEAAEY